MKRAASVSIVLLALFSAPAFAQNAPQNTVLEENEQNCRLIRTLSTSSYEGLTKSFNKARKDYDFIRSRWDRGACNAVVDTPQGPISCFVTTILKGPSGNVFGVIASPISGQVTCF